jgi:hypothetical protein
VGDVFARVAAWLVTGPPGFFLSASIDALVVLRLALMPALKKFISTTIPRR